MEQRTLAGGTDLPSQGSPRLSEWTLHCKVIRIIWERYGEAHVVLFALPENAQCHLYYSDCRASSTTNLYRLKWKRFESWCFNKGLVYRVFYCSNSSFLQGLFEKGKAYSTLKGYLAAISACHIGFDGVSRGAHPFPMRAPPPQTGYAVLSPTMGSSLGVGCSL